MEECLFRNQLEHFFRLVERHDLFRETGERKYLEMAQFFIDRRGRGVIGGNPVLQDHKPFRELDEPVGHAVRMMYLCCGATDVLMETGDQSLWPALERIWHRLTERRMYVTGGVGARHAGEAFGADFELPSSTAYAETCAAIGNAFWNFRMLLLTGDVRYADVMELAIYNGALAGIALDGRHYFYVNPLCDRGGHRRQRYFGCACCPPNIARLLASLPGYIYCTCGDALCINLYIASRCEVEVGGQRVRISLKGRLPEFAVRIDEAAGNEFGIYLRVPAWARGARASINGRSAAEGEPDSYLQLRRQWKAGDEIVLQFDVRPELLVSHPWVEATAGRCAIRYGPFIFCLEQPDNPDADVWSIEIDASSPLQVKWLGDLLEGTWVVEGEGWAASESWAGKLYLPLDRAPGAVKRVRWRAIPYALWANRQPGPMHVWPLMGRR